MRKLARVCVLLLLAALLLQVACKPTPTQVAEEESSKPPAADVSSPSSSSAAQPGKDPESKAPEVAEGQTWAYTEGEGLDKLDSYRLKTVTSVSEGDEPPSTVEMLIEHSKANSAERIVIGTNVPGSEGAEDGSFEMIRIGSDRYARIAEDQWISMQIADEELIPPSSVLYSPTNLLENSEGKFGGTESINGVKTDVYVFDKQSFASSGLFGPISEASGKVWFSKEYDLAIRSDMHIVGTDLETGKTATIDVRSDLSDINTEIEIQVPEGVEKAEAPDDVPVMPGATDMVSMMGMTRYEIAKTAEEVTKFYETELVKAGWKAAAMQMPGFLSYEKDDRSVHITVQEAGDVTNVAIVLEGE